MSDQASAAQIKWAHTYDGYRRLASTPEQLERMLRSARSSYANTGAVPDWCGVDFLRGWTFFLVRADHHAGGGTLNAEWSAVLEALRVHPDARSEDRPPRSDQPRPASPPIALPTEFSDQPKMHRHADFLKAKQARLWEPHVAPINTYVDHIADETDSHVPYVDPDSGGTRARVLFVLESPAGPAALGSGMLSADNNDETAKNIWHAYQASGMPRTYGLHWNAVPWYVGTGKKNKSVTTAEVARGHKYLLELLELAPEIRVVLALGRHAQKSISGAAVELASRGLVLLDAPHPGPIQAGVTKGASLAKVNDGFRKALFIAGRGRAHR